MEGTNGVLTRRIGIVTRYAIVNCGPYKNAAALEGESGVGSHLKSHGLATLASRLSARSIIKTYAFPGICDGLDPACREWTIEGTNIRQGADSAKLLSRGMAHLIEFGMRAVTRDAEGNNPVINYAPLTHVKWKETLGQYKLVKAVELCPSAGQILIGLRMGIKQITGDDGIGYRPGQKTPKELGIRVSWRGKHGNFLIAEVAKQGVIEGICRKHHPELFTNQETRIPNPRQLLEFGRLYELFNKVATDCLRNSGFTLEDALKTVPEYHIIFGWRPTQIKSWEIPHEGIWNGSKGRQLFRAAFAYSLWLGGCGQLNVDNEKITFTTDWPQMNGWLRASKMNSTIDFYNFLGTHRLSGGLSNAVKGGSIGNAFSLLFNGKQSNNLEQGQPKLVRGKLHDYVGALFEINDDKISVPLGKIDKASSNLFKPDSDKYSMHVSELNLNFSH